MKNLLLFGGYDGFSGGWNDFINSFWSVEEIKDYVIERKLKGNPLHWIQVVSISSMEIIEIDCGLI